MKIIIDTQGCDFPDKLIRGSVNAANAHSDYTFVLVGDEKFISSVVTDVPSNMQIIHAPDVITNDDSPAFAIRRKPDSSLSKSIYMLKEDDEAIGLVSGGNTGAVLTGATLVIGRVEGVMRPALVSLIPTAVDGKLVCISDSGANVDSKPEYMAQFALIGSLYVKTVFGVENPVVGLLSVGTEDKKGDERTKEAFKLIKNMPLNFAGNMEARDTLTGKYDVVVCDGFSGNVLVKSTEGTAKMVMNKLKGAIKSSFSAKIGALFMKKALMSIKKSMDYHAYGGGAFLGVNKLIVKTHGSTNEVSAKASIERIIQLHENDIIGSLKKGISAMDTQTAEEK